MEEMELISFMEMQVMTRFMLKVVYRVILKEVPVMTFSLEV